MTNDEFKMLQALPLELKVAKTKQRIIEFAEHFGKETLYVSFSGGKDSTVLLDIVRSIYPDMEAVFIDTGLEYPEIRQFVHTFDNVTVLRPRMNFKQVIEKYGYPVISKDQSRFIYDIRTSKSQKMIDLRLNGTEKGHFKVSERWKHMIHAPFKISNKCCDVMKKNPLRRFHYKKERYAIVGTLADESATRKINYLKTGCNAFDKANPKSQPLGFWREQDKLEYIYTRKLKIAPVYGEVTFDDEMYHLTGVQRTGCVFCLYGCHLEQEPNRIQRLKQTHPELHKYCLDKLGLREVMEYMEIKYE